MKITRENLEPAILEKLDRLDQLYNDFNDNRKNEFLSFDGKSFHGQKINDLSLRKMTSINELEVFKEHLYKEETITKNSFMSNFNVNNRAIENLKTQIVKLKGITFFETKSQIRTFKKYKDSLLILDRDGNFTNFDIKADEINYELNLAEKVKNLFAIKNFLPYDILDFQIFRTGFLFSTSHYGIFYADVAENTIEVIFPEQWVLKIKVIDDNDILFISKDGSFSIYDFDKGLKIESFNKIKQLNQTIKRIEIGRNPKYNRIYVLAQNEATNHTKHILHVFEKDNAGIGYNDITAKVFPGYNVLNSIINTLCLCDTNILVCGLRDKHLFTWNYDKEKMNIKFEEMIFDKVSFEKLNFIKFENQILYTSLDNKLIGMNLSGDVIYNIELDDSEILDIIFDENNSFYAISDNKVSFYSIPSYNKSELEFTAKVYEGPSTNNIEIFVKSNTGDQLISFVDPDTLEEIQPNYHIIYNNDSFIKISGRNVKELIMKIRITPSTEIEGIVVNANRIFLK